VFRFLSFLIAYLKSFFNVLKSLLNISSLATNIYLPSGKLSSFFKTKERKTLFALFLCTAFPTFLEATNATFKSSSEIKKATKDLVCHLLLLL
jgi:hypothetical protein